MNLFDWIARLGRRPQQHTAEHGFENFGSQPADPSQDQYWRSIPHPARMSVPSHADWLAEILKTLQDHRNGIDEATGPFLDALIDAQTETHRLAAQQHYPIQIRADQGLYAGEAGYQEQLRLQERAFLRRISEADQDYRAGRDALLGTPGATPAWDARTGSAGHDAPAAGALPAPPPQTPEAALRLGPLPAPVDPAVPEQDEDERAA